MLGPGEVAIYDHSLLQRRYDASQHVGKEKVAEAN